MNAKENHVKSSPQRPRRRAESRREEFAVDLTPNEKKILKTAIENELNARKAKGTACQRTLRRTQ